MLNLDIGWSLRRRKRKQTGYWADPVHRKLFLINFAQANGFDAYIAENWRGVTEADIISAKVFEFALALVTDWSLFTKGWRLVKDIQWIFESRHWWNLSGACPFFASHSISRVNIVLNVSSNFNSFAWFFYTRKEGDGERVGAGAQEEVLCTWLWGHGRWHYHQKVWGRNGKFVFVSHCCNNQHCASQVQSRGGFFSFRTDFFVQRGKWYYEVLLLTTNIFQIGTI